MKEETPPKNDYLLTLFKALVKYEVCSTLCVGAEVTKKEFDQKIDVINIILREQKFKEIGLEYAHKGLAGTNPTDEVLNKLCVALLKNKYGYCHWIDFTDKEKLKIAAPTKNEKLFPLVRRRLLEIIVTAEKITVQADINQQNQANEEKLVPLKARLFDLQEEKLTLQTEANELRQRLQEAQLSKSQTAELKQTLAQKEADFNTIFDQHEALRQTISQQEADHKRAIAATHQQIKNLESLLATANEQIETLQQQAKQDNKEAVLQPVYALIEAEQWQEALEWLAQDEANEAQQTTQLVGDKWVLRGQIWLALTHTDEAEKCYRKATQYRPLMERWEALAHFYATAKQLYAQADSLKNAHSHAPTDPEQARLAYSLGVLYESLQRYEESDRYYQKALAITERLAQAQPDAFEADLSHTYNNLGSLYKTLQRYEESDRYYQKALAIRERLAQAQPDAFEADLSHTYNNLGVLFSTLQRYEESDRYYQKALAILERLAQEQPDAFEAYLSHTYHNLGNLYSTLQRYEESDRYYQKALAILEPLAQAQPDAFEADLSQTYNNLGNLYSTLQRYEESESYHQKALAIRERLAQEQPDAFEAYLSHTYHNLGNLYSTLQRYEESDRYYQKALAIRERLAQAQPDAFEAYLSHTYNNLGDLYSTLQRYEESDRYYQKALAIYARLAQAQPDAFEVDYAKMLYGYALLQKKQGTPYNDMVLQAIRIFEQHPTHPESQAYLFKLRKIAAFFKEEMAKISNSYQKIVQFAQKEEWEGVLHACKDFESRYQKLPPTQQAEDQDLYAEMLMWRGRAYSCRSSVAVIPAKESLSAAHQLFCELEESTLAWQNGFYLMEELKKELSTGWMSRWLSNKKQYEPILAVYQTLQALGEPADKTFVEKVNAIINSLRTL